MSAMRMLGILALVVGAVLVVVGFNSSGAPVDQVSNALTGRYTDRTMWYLIGGVVLLVGGGLAAAFGRRA